MTETIDIKATVRFKDLDITGMTFVVEHDGVAYKRHCRINKKTRGLSIFDSNGNFIVDMSKNEIVRRLQSGQWQIQDVYELFDDDSSMHVIIDDIDNSIEDCQFPPEQKPTNSY